ncbi:MAG: hypothetical protein WCK91_00580 [bacterium]
MTKFFTAVLAVLSIATLASAQAPHMAPAGKKAAAHEKARFENAVRSFDALALVVKPTQSASHVAMVVNAGVVYDDWSLGIMAIAHRVIPAGSLIGLRIRKDDGTTSLEGVQKWDQDVAVGVGIGIKFPGGGTLFGGGSKQYELVIVDSKTLETTVDYVPAFGESVIKSSPTLGAAAGSTYMQVPLMDSSSTSVDAVIIGGSVIPADSFSLENGRVLVNLTKSKRCFGGGDVSVTIVRGGKSDTTSTRFGSISCQSEPAVPTVP